MTKPASRGVLYMGEKGVSFFLIYRLTSEHEGPPLLICLVETREVKFIAEHISSSREIKKFRYKQGC